MRRYTLVLDGTDGRVEFLLNNDQRSSFHSVLPLNSPPNTMFTVEYEFSGFAQSVAVSLTDVINNNLPAFKPRGILCNLSQFGHVQDFSNTVKQGAIAVAVPSFIALATTPDWIYLQKNESAKSTFVTNSVWNADRVMITAHDGSVLRGWHRFTFIPNV